MLVLSTVLLLLFKSSAAFFFGTAGCNNGCACPQPQCPPIQQCPTYPPCPTPTPLLPPLPPPPPPPPPPAPLLPFPSPSGCGATPACPPPVLPFLPAPACTQTPSCPETFPVAPPSITTVSATSYGGPYAYPASGPLPPTPVEETRTLPPLVELPTPGYAQSIPAPLPPPPSLVSIAYPTAPTIQEAEAKPVSPFQASFIEDVAPTLIPPPSASYRTEYTSPNAFVEKSATVTRTQQEPAPPALPEYDDNAIASAPPAPVDQTAVQGSFMSSAYGPTADPQLEEDDKIYANRDGDVRLEARDGDVKQALGLSSEQSPYFGGVRSAIDEQLEGFSSHQDFKRHKQLSSTTVEHTTATCNSEKLARVMATAITPDVSIAKRLVQKATELAFDGSKFDVFCATGEFSYSIHSRKYCEVSKDEVTCFAFR